MFPPWDLLRGRDVFRDSILLTSELEDSMLQHWAPNCGTFSRARERLIPGAVFSPPPLRSDEFPRGIPEVIVSLPAPKRRKLELDTDSLENPKNSIARELDTWKALEGAEGVFSTEYHACMFEGSRRRKAQVLIHNYPPLERVGKLCDRSGLCSRTGKPHLSWRPRVVGGRVTSFATSEEREYPAGFCDCYASALEDLPEGPFVEIFSGKNAPLSASLAKAWGVSLPKADKSLVDEKGEVVEFSETQRGKSVEPVATKGATAPCVNEGPEPANCYRSAAVQAAKQPSYGKRQQLILDGLLDPSRHIEEAKKLQHPFDALTVLKTDHQTALDSLRDPQTLIAKRFESLDMLRAWVNELKPQQTVENRSASWTAKKLGCKPNTLVMRRLQTLLQIEDAEVPDLCLSGLRITGPASESPFFEDHDVMPTMSQHEFLSGLSERSERMIERVQFMAEKGDPALAAAIWEKTQKEVAKGTMGPPLSLEDVQKLYGKDFQITPSFGLAQGLDEQGQRKYRRIDDYTASGVNPSAHRKQKVPMCMVDYI